VALIQAPTLLVLHLENIHVQLFDEVRVHHFEQDGADWARLVFGEAGLDLVKAVELDLVDGGVDEMLCVGVRRLPSVLFVE